MKKKFFISEDELIDLGFNKNYEQFTYYYSLDITEFISIISSDNDSVNSKGEWYLELYEKSILKNRSYYIIDAIIKLMK